MDSINDAHRRGLIIFAKEDLIAGLVRNTANHSRMNMMLVCSNLWWLDKLDQALISYLRMN